MSKGSFCQVTLLGNLGKDPEIKYTPQGTPVGKFSVATTSSYKGKDGNWQDKTEWHNVVVWQRLAEIAGEYLHKGDKIFIIGRLETNSWDDKQSGKRMYMTQIVAERMEMVGKRGDGGGQSRQPNNGFDDQQSRADDHQQSSSTIVGGPITDDDIPF